LLSNQFTHPLRAYEEKEDRSVNQGNEKRTRKRRRSDATTTKMQKAKGKRSKKKKQISNHGENELTFYMHIFLYSVFVMAVGVRILCPDVPLAPIMPLKLLSFW